MATLIDAVLSGKRFRIKQCEYNEGQHGVWLKMCKTDDEFWPMYDECNTWLKSYDTYSIGDIFGDSWEIDNSEDK